MGFDDNDSFSQKLKQEYNLLKNRCASEAEIRQVLYSTRVSSLSLNKTYAAPSTIAGIGLFAAQDILPGEILTCYPGDVLIIPQEEDRSDNDKILWGSHVQQDDFSRSDENIRSEYLLATGTMDWIIAALPKLGTSNLSYLGHYANDSVEPPNCDADLSRYVLESQERSNAMHTDWENYHMVTIATKEIEAAEEILVSYGPDYWMQQEEFNAETKKKRRRKSTSNSRSKKGFG